MNAPQLIMPETPIAEKPFRLKGCRYHLLYSGHLSKEIYYNWFRHNLMPRRDAQLALFIANINVNGAQFTKVIFKFNVTIDWKSIDKLDFPIGTGKSRPEVRPIYKSNWSTEYMNMVKQDPHTYPPLNDVNIISARSPKRVKGVSVVPPTPVPISVEPMAVSVSVSPLTIDQNSINPSVKGETDTDTAIGSTDIKEKIQDVISEMGILNKLNTLEELIKSISVPVQAKPSQPTEIVQSIPVKTDITYGIFIDGDASDLIPTEDMPKLLLENKSVISIYPITSESKNAIHTTKNSMNKILEIFKTYGIWYRKYKDKIVMKNSDIMFATLYIVI